MNLLGVWTPGWLPPAADLVDLGGAIASLCGFQITLKTLVQ